MYRTTKNQRIYDDHRARTKADGCPFCNMPPEKRKTIEESAHALVIQNIFPYEVWEGFKATEHLLLIPKRHVSSLNELNSGERTDIMNLYCKYEALGFNLYSRAPGSGARTHAHVHTHFIKIEGDIATELTFTKTPYSLEISW